MMKRKRSGKCGHQIFWCQRRTNERRTTNDERRTTNDERRTTKDERRTTTNDERRMMEKVVFSALKRRREGDGGTVAVVAIMGWKDEGVKKSEVCDRSMAVTG